MALVKISEIVAHAKEHAAVLVKEAAEVDRIKQAAATQEEPKNALAKELKKLAQALSAPENDPMRLSVGDLQAFAEQVRKVYHE
jgi:hypothetical protein